MNPVTMGGAMVGLCIVLHRLVTWWPGLKGIAGRGVRCLSDLLPFVFAYAVGALFIMCAGGLIGYAADWTLWGTNWLGDTALVWGVGGTGDQDVTRRGPQQALTNGGHMVTVLLLVGLLAARKRSGSQDLGTGLLAGIALGCSAGALGTVAVPLASAVNWAGSVFTTSTLGGA
jgi:hypothetical protein